MIYLFAFDLCEECSFSGNFQKTPVATARKSRYGRLKWTYEGRQLFQQFVPALLLNGKYVPLSSGVCIGNPEMLADNAGNVPEPKSKKGLLLDPQMLETPLLTDLGVKYAIYNIPLSHIMGETDNEAFPTILYEYQGKTYKFNGAGINGYDYLFGYLTDSGMNCTAIILNDWNEEYPQMIHPLSRNEDVNAYYYAFNTADEEGASIWRRLQAFWQRGIPARSTALCRTGSLQMKSTSRKSGTIWTRTILKCIAPSLKRQCGFSIMRQRAIMPTPTFISALTMNGTAIKITMIRISMRKSLWRP